MERVTNNQSVQPGLAFRGCRKSYGQLQALNDVNFDVAYGRIVGLVGPNGAGKTTLLHALMGLICLDTGLITLDGENVRSVKAKQRIAFMPDDLPRPGKLSGREMLEFTCRLYGRRPEGVETLARRLQLNNRLDHRLETYSHGMRRKVDFMSALLLLPDILILDEPFSGLDPGMVALEQEILEELRDEGVGVLLSSHDLELIESLADDLVMIDHGKVVFQGTTKDLVANASTGDIRSAFLTLTNNSGGEG